MISENLKANELSEIGSLLKSEKALLMLEKDVFWPKWDSPWWYVLLLEETGRLNEIPPNIIKELINCADSQYIKVLPIKDEGMNGTINSYTEVMDFRLLGGLMKVSSLLKLDIFTYIPWAKNWINRYQLSDGGYGCNDSSSDSVKKSIISTTVMLEGLIEYSRFLNDTETYARNMFKAVTYIIQHQIYLSINGHEIPDTDWDKIIFPRFCEYDFSRGLEVVLDFLLLTERKLKHSSIEQALLLLRRKTDIGLGFSEKQWLADEKTVSYYIEKPILFKDSANVPLVMKKLNSRNINEFVPTMLARISRKYEEVKTRNLVI